MKTALSLFFLSCTLHLSAQTNWVWAKSAGIPDQDYAAEVSTDGFGNSYLTGDFGGPTITFGATTLTNPANNNFYLAKYDPAGNVLWAKCGVPNPACYATGASADAAGNVCVTGYFYGPYMVIGTDTLPGTNCDMFLLKYNASGNLLWAKSFGGPNADAATGVYLDQSGNCFVTGYFRSPAVVFDTTTLNNSTASIDIFLAKLDAAGNVLWARSGGGTNTEEVSGIAVDAGGNCLITGRFSSATATFGTTVLTNSSFNDDMYLVKYDPAGNVVWARSNNGWDDDAGNAVAVDAGGNSYLAGYFRSDTIFFGSTMLVNAYGTNDMFFVKYDASGNVVWAKKIDGNDSDVGSSVSVDTYGNIFFAGNFSSATLSVGPFTVNNANTSGGSLDAMLAKYDPAGNVLWVKGIGASASDGAASVDVNTSNVCFFAGSFTSLALAFGQDTLINPFNPSSGADYDIFLAKLEDVTGINNASENTNMFLLFPNPSDGIVFVHSNSSEGELAVCNVAGEIVFQTRINASVSTLDLSAQANGIYFIKVKNETGCSVQKIILSR